MGKMKSFQTFLKEETEEEKLKHIHHAEDRPLFHGASGFEHAHGALNQAHEHIASGKSDSSLTMKYDGSPSLVFGHHPETGKFFVASKSAFNKNPKINYTDKDIDSNHGHAPGLVEKLKQALKHLPKVAPKSGVYQGDVMHSHGDVHYDKDKGTASYTPNTIKYTAHGDDAKKAAESKFGLVVHQKYEGKDFASMRATPNVDHNKFGQHKDVHLATAEHDTSKVKYSQADQKKFQQYMNAAKEIHDTHGDTMYSSMHPEHRGESGHLATYINQTVRKGTKPNAKGFIKHVQDVYEKKASKLKSDKGQTTQRNLGAAHAAHVTRNSEHYDNLFKMHQNLQQAKNVLVKNLNQHTAGLEHHIGDSKTDPEGYVVNYSHKGKQEPTKLVNRAEFSRANLLKTRK